MDKLELNYLSSRSAKNYRYLSVPKELLENPLFSSLDYGAIILFAKMLERAGLSARHEDKFSMNHHDSYRCQRCRKYRKEMGVVPNKESQDKEHNFKRNKKSGNLLICDKSI